MTCHKHPSYDGSTSPNWSCRACRKIRNASKPSETTTREKGDTQEIEFTTQLRVKTLDDIIRVCHIDTATWEVERWVCNKWDQAAIPRAVGKNKKWKRTSTKPIITELYQVKVWLKRRTALVDARQEIEGLKELARKGISASRSSSSSQKPSASQRATKQPGRCDAARSSGLMLEIDIPDLHVGKLAWSSETGWPDYDGDEAETLHDDALCALLERTIHYNFEQIIYVLGNDLLHSDTKFGTTTAGTQLDTDSRYQKNFARVRNLGIRAINRLRGIAPTRAVMVPGNHDTLSTWHLGDSLECYYHETPGVIIDNSPCLRKYHQWGQVMLMFTHGQNGKLKDYPLLMATEQPYMFGSTSHREAHTGHTHQLRVQELNGIRVRTLPALCPPDAWHADKGFVGNLRSAEAFIWHKDDGLIGTAIYNVKEDKK